MGIEAWDRKGREGKGRERKGKRGSRAREEVFWTLPGWEGIRGLYHRGTVASVLLLLFGSSHLTLPFFFSPLSSLSTFRIFAKTDGSDEDQVFPGHGVDAK
jgi:hypothetical protein